MVNRAKIRDGIRIFLIALGSWIAVIPLREQVIAISPIQNQIILGLAIIFGAIIWLK